MKTHLPSLEGFYAKRVDNACRLDNIYPASLTDLCKNHIIKGVRDLCHTRNPIAQNITRSCSRDPNVPVYAAALIGMGVIGMLAISIFDEIVSRRHRSSSPVKEAKPKLINPSGFVN